MDEKQKDNKEKLYSRLCKPAFYVALLGAAKLVTDAFGLQLVSDDQVNSIANGLAALVTVVGVAIGY
ncbi:hypothetical protein [Syntrophomonas wolfei]|jgi:uncharacterized membrane protein|uniref:hypothetical protein n=1 Tax=Syntrophomonas wolfei TaxID=863 RepID=UPI0023F267B1|nr:hypothetical protein [Syntrophomonas wolfei]